MAQTESLRVDPADRDMVQGDGRSQYEADKAKKAEALPKTPAHINTPSAAGNAIKRIEWCRTAMDFMVGAKTKDELQAWWKDNTERLGVVETALPGEHEKLIIAFDEAIERTAVRAA